MLSLGTWTLRDFILVISKYSLDSTVIAFFLQKKPLVNNYIIIILNYAGPIVYHPAPPNFSIGLPLVVWWRRGL